MPDVNFGGYAAAAFAGLVLGGLAAGVWYGPKLQRASQDLAATRGELRQVVGANQQCTSDVDQANGAVRALREEAEARARQAASAVAAAEGRARVAELKAVDLARRPPARPDDLCGSLDELLTEAIKERRQ